MRITFDELVKLTQSLQKLKNDETVKNLPDYSEYKKHIEEINKVIYLLLI